MRVFREWRFAVVRAYILALVAAENPAVEVALFALAAALDCGARNAARSIYMSLYYSIVRACVDAAATLATAHRNEGLVVVVALLGHNYLAEQDKCAELRCYEQ